METTYDKRTGRALRQGATQDYSGVDPSLLRYSGTTGQAITSDSLKPTLKVNLPEKVTPVYDNLSLPEVTTPLEMEQKRLKEEKTSQEGNISKLLSDIGVVQGSEADFATKAGADTAQQEYDRFASELEAEQRNIEKKKLDIIRNNPTGALRGGQQDLLDNLQRESLAKQADIAILGNAAKGRFDTAMSIAKRKVESALIPLKAELDAKKFIYDNNKDIFSKAELSKLDGLIKADDSKIKKEEERLTKGNEMIINALSFKAPTALIDKAKAILAKGGTQSEVASVLGSYLIDPLDRDLKKAQINSSNASAASSYANAAKTRTETDLLKEPGGGKPPSDTQIQNAGFAERILQANKIIDGKVDTFAKMGYKDFFLASSNSQIANKLLTPDVRQAAQAMRNFITAKLRKESGAAISQSEFDDARVQYFPALGDDEQTLINKKELRDSVFNNLVQGSGSAYKVDTVDTYLDNSVVPTLNAKTQSATSYWLNISEN